MARYKELTIGIALILVEISLVFAFFSFIPSNVVAVIGNPNATVTTLLEIGNVYPDIMNVSIDNDAATVTLTPNASTLVSCVTVIRDYNGDADINFTNATFYDSNAVGPTAADDNNTHYSNTSCELIANTGGFNGYADDPYHSLANCTFQVQYYANPSANWVCNSSVYDQVNWTDQDNDEIEVSQLIALGVPDSINYGLVNATYVSNENQSNITNLGNVQINVSLESYGISQGDGLAMNCTLGNIGNISAMWEKYNLTASTPGQLSLSAFETAYTNITSSPVIKNISLGARTNDAVNDAINPSYWRIYVPTGVAGTCNGSIIFGATTAAGS